MDLKLCSGCKALWLEVPWEPYASFPYLVRWPYAKKEWYKLRDIDDGALLRQWHHAKLVENIANLSQEESTAVREHQLRSSYRSPLDETPPPMPDLLAYLES